MSYQFSPEELETLATYSKIADGWNAFSSAHWKDNLWYYWLQHISGERRVLDLGCGTGRDAELVISDGLHYVGIDLSEAMLAIAKRDFADEVASDMVEFFSMNMCELEFPPESFDAFRSITSFMHVPKANLPIALREAHRILKPTGVGFISIPYGTLNGMHESDRHDSGRTLCVCYLEDEFLRALEDAGFDLIYAGVHSSMLLCIVRKR